MSARVARRCLAAADTDRSSRRARSPRDRPRDKPEIRDARLADSVRVRQRHPDRQSRPAADPPADGRALGNSARAGADAGRFHGAIGCARLFAAGVWSVRALPLGLGHLGAPAGGGARLSEPACLPATVGGRSHRLVGARYCRGQGTLHDVDGGPRSRLSCGRHQLCRRGLDFVDRQQIFLVSFRGGHCDSAAPFSAGLCRDCGSGGRGARR